MLCPHSSSEFKDFLAFGKKYINKCHVYLDTYIKSTPFYFYELYLKDLDGSFLSVPVMLKNYKNSLGLRVNSIN